MPIKPGTGASELHDATIHPGTQTVTAGGQCTANFIFTDASNVYIGQAAHCSSTGAATDTNGCDSASLPIGTPVQIDGASQPGTMAYNSWLTMQAEGETDPNACAYNDLALVRIHPDDVAKVNPSIPPGDSGSPFVDASGAALGVLSTLSIAPLPAANNVSDIGHMLAYLNAKSPLKVQLVDGTEAFNPDPINGLVGGALAGLGV